MRPQISAGTHQIASTAPVKSSFIDSLGHKKKKKGLWGDSDSDADYTSGSEDDDEGSEDAEQFKDDDADVTDGGEETKINRTPPKPGVRSHLSSPVAPRVPQEESHREFAPSPPGSRSGTKRSAAKKPGKTRTSQEEKADEEKADKLYESKLSGQALSKWRAAKEKGNDDFSTLPVQPDTSSSSAAKAAQMPGPSATIEQLKEKMKMDQLREQMKELDQLREQMMMDQLREQAKEADRRGTTSEEIEEGYQNSVATIVEQAETMRKEGASDKKVKEFVDSMMASIESVRKQRLEVNPSAPVAAAKPSAPEPSHTPLADKNAEAKIKVAQSALGIETKRV
ncbi:MAG: hypothetical protein P4N59_04960, partial [Negativicutes bacterium]|nr:hypothetical protein [Negativicutes bacterium]